MAFIDTVQYRRECNDDVPVQIIAGLYVGIYEYMAQ